MLVHVEMALTALDSAPVEDTAQYLRHSRSPIWTSVELRLRMPNVSDRLNNSFAIIGSDNRPILFSDAVTRWRVIDNELAHPSYSNVISIRVYCFIARHMLPSGYKCVNDLFADLLPRWRHQIDVVIYEEDGIVYNCLSTPKHRCAYHEAGENSSECQDL